MKAIITGANGFIGSNLARRLTSDGWRVTGIVRKTSDLTFLHGIDLELVDTGLNDAGVLAGTFAGADVVFHCAARASDWGSMEIFRRSNVDATRHVMEAAASAAVRRVVFISSTVVYGFGGHVDTDESAPKRPELFPYCLTKLEAERLVEQMARERGVEFAIIRPGNVFGPNDRITMIHLLDFLERGRFIHVNGGRTLTCPTYVENLVDAIVLAGTRREAANEDFIITDGLRITWREYIDAICGVLRVRPPRLSVSAGPVYALAALMEWAWKRAGAKDAPIITRYRIGQVRRDYHFSIEKARRVLGFEPKVGLDEAIGRTVAWYRRREE
ncbi:MAG TPA: NAD-dependent epimerase/dehydratase family protein [Planctomycetota bacterium]|nr:NAD-dependent epimerase/dehydratase family protein [Planctomycetota bacterium]